MAEGQPIPGEPANGQADAPLVQESFYILAASPLADDLRRVLKHDETFAVFDHYGDIKSLGLGEEGLFHEGTRYLSALILKLGNDSPLFLSSTVKEGNALVTVDLTNSDVVENDCVVLPRGVLHLFRSKFLWRGACYERLLLRNYGLEAVSATVFFHYHADFADVFEVRGTPRPQKGKMLPPQAHDGQVLLRYQGLDGVVRRTQLQFSPAPASLTPTRARFDLAIQPKSETTLFLVVSCAAEDGVPANPLCYQEALALAESTLRSAKAGRCEIHTSNEQFNDWLNRSSADLDMMLSHTPHGIYPYAGVPWFSTPFGRDGIITALELLWANPAIAHGVLNYLAATQAHARVPEQDAEPGKILHETRLGEMAALGEVPFKRYYGSVDSTPLFVMLAGAYYERTGDRALVERLWPNIEAALLWIDEYGDPDGDGFVEYFRQTHKGLVHQGWKDSHDSVFHSDGSAAGGPIALCEVQGYVFAAKRSAARLAVALGLPDRAEALNLQAQSLVTRFEEAFWCEDLSTYALALDGDKRPCRVRASNAGHCLFTGIADPLHARRVANVLLDEDSFSQWGIRTLSAGEVRYNPMSYHNGSVWPHDNALIAAGMASYRFHGAALRVLTGLFDASIFFDLHRMPELFCGFQRRPGEGPTLYPVACAPQAWSAGAVYMLLQASLGLRIDATRNQIGLCYPSLPASLKEIRICDLQIGDASVDLVLQRHGHDVGVNVLRREGHVEIVVVK